MLDLPEPDTTFDGKYYKIPKKEYRRVLATAKQADVIKRNNEVVEKRLNERESALNRREADIEKKRKLPMKEQMELAVLRKLRESVEWLANHPMIPQTIRRLLERALGGEELVKTMGREQPERKQEKQYQLSR